MSKSVAVTSKSQVTLLKSGLRLGVDYVLLNQETWDFVRGLYGGGPEIYLGEAKEEEFSYSVVLPDQLHKYETLKNLRQINLQPVGLTNELYYCYMNATL